MRSTVVKSFSIAAVLALAATGLLLHPAARAADAHAVPAPAVDLPAAAGTLQTVVLSGGCFWGIQGVFEHVKGVERAVAGYAGGSADTAQYETVSGGDTGHAESVQVTFDPKQISYGHLLQIFFSVALDPTEVNRQGPDDGTQYRSEVWATNGDQARVAKAYIAQLDKAHVFDAPIATRVDMLPAFYPAEAYHQDFLVRNPEYPYIVYNDLPKVAALKAVFPQDYREQAKITDIKS
jgi:peptide-methionine (S)-S-oxide reductase